MLCIRRAWLLAALVTLPLAVGCKKDEEKKSEGSGAGATAAEKSGDIGKAMGGGAGQAAQASADLDMIPVDSEIVAGVNFAQLQQSALWQKNIMPKLATGNFLAELGKLKSNCGFDPMVAIKTISIGLKDIGAGKPQVVAVVHGLDKAKTMACLDNQKIKDDLATDKVEVQKDGDVALLLDRREGNNAAVKFVDDSTCVVVVGGKATKDGIQGVIDGKSALRTSPAFVDMYGKLNPQDSVWALVNGGMKGLEKLTALLGLKPKALFGTINVTDGLTADLRMRVDSPSQAAETAAGLSQQVGMAKQFVDNIGVTSEGADVKLTLAISNAKLMALAQMGKSGGLGGMGGM